MGKLGLGNAAIAGLCALLISACGGGGGFSDGGGSSSGGTSSGGTSGGGATGVVAALTVTADPTTISADGVSTSRVVATLTDTAGVGVAGQELSFLSNAGTLSTAAAPTDANGKTTVFLKSGTNAGRATLTVRHAGTGLSQQLSVSFVSGAASSLSITAAPNSIRPGQSTSVVAVVSDAGGNPVSGEQVTFSVPTNKSGGRFETTVLTTDVSGRAIATYTAGSVPGTDSIKANLAGPQQAIASLTISETANAISGIQISTGSTSAVADGATKILVRAHLVDAANVGVPNALVAFSATAGTLSTVTQTTDASGNAQVMLTTPTRTGEAIVRVSSGGFSASQTIQFVAGAAAAVTLSAAPSQLPPRGVSALRATVTDSFGNRVSSVSLNISATIGTLSASGVVTNTSGEAEVQFTAPTLASGSATATITATAAGDIPPATQIIQISPDFSTVTGVTLTTGATQVAPGQTVALRATITTSDGSASGLTVNFFTSAGTLSAGSKLTDSSGVAQVELQAPNQAAVLQVRASIAGVSSNSTINVVSGTPANVTLGLSPISVSANGSTTLTASVTDASGNAVDNAVVRFEIANNRSGGTLGAVQATTDANGRATTTYTAGTNVPSGEVMDDFKATVAGVTAPGTASLRVRLQGSALSLNASSNSVVADGASRTTLSATVTDDNGTPVPGVSVQFVTTTGSFVVTPASTAASVNTDASGIARIQLQAPDRIGQANIRATAVGFTAVTTVQFVAGPPTAVSLSASPTSIRPGASASVVATVTDSKGNAVSGEAVTLSVTSNKSGGRFDSTQVMTDAGGRATATYTAGPTAGDMDTLRAQIANGTFNTASLDVAFEAKAIGSIQLTLGATSAPADGISTTVVRAKLLDQSGQPLPGGSVTFSTTEGVFATPGGNASTANATTDSSGNAQVQLTSPTQAGSAVVRAASGGYSSSQTIQFVSGKVKTVVVSAAPSDLPPGGISSLRATATDSNGNRVAAAPLNFSTTSGTLAQSSVTTNASGEATVQFTAANPSPADATVTVSSTASGSTPGSTVLHISADNATVSGVTLTTGATQVTPGQEVVLRATVTTSSGSVAGLTVNFATSGSCLPAAACLSKSSELTNASGTAEVRFTAPSQAGNVQVSASVSGFTSNATISVVSGTPASLNFTLSPASLSVGQATTLLAEVFDNSGNPVSNAAVRFEVPDNKSGGALTTVQVQTDANGRATTTYTAGSLAGTDKLQALVSGLPAKSADLIVGQKLATLTLLSSAPTLSSDGAASVILTALAKDASNNVLSGQTVSFSADSGAIIVSQPATDGGGRALATLSNGGDPRNRDINVTASSGGKTSTITVSVVGTTVKISGAANTQRNVETPYTLLLVDAAGKGISGVTVQLTTEAGNVLRSTGTVVSSVTTNGSGQASFTLTATNASSTITANASTVNATSTLPVTVSTDEFNFTAPVSDGSVVDLGSGAVTLEVTWLQNGNPVPDGTQVKFSTTRGTLSAFTANTLAGKAGVTLTATDAGVANVVASSDLLTKPSATRSVRFRATEAASTVVQASPAVIATSQSSVITAVVRDANNNLVADKTVEFSLTDISGGSLSSPTAVTNEQGLAQVSYQATSATTAKDGVTVRAKARNTGGTEANGSTTLTVGSRALRITLGTGNEMSEPNETTYALPYSAIVTDAAGNPISNAEFHLSVLPTRYVKGFYSGLSTEKKVVNVTATCANEDANLDGILDTEDTNRNGVLDAGEDVNGNGSLDRNEDADGDGVADPGNVATVPPSPTLTNGQVQFDITYPQDRGNWVEVELSARVVVSGSEATEKAVFTLPILEDDAINPPATNRPFGGGVRAESPYGHGSSCTSPE